MVDSPSDFINDNLVSKKLLKSVPQTDNVARLRNVRSAP